MLEAASFIYISSPHPSTAAIETRSGHACVLYDHEPSTASFALCFKSVPMSFSASEEFVLEFPCPKHRFSSGSYPLGLSGLGHPTCSSATTDLVLRVTGNQKPLHHGIMGIHCRANQWYREIIAVCSQIHTKHIDTLCGQNVEFVNVKPGGTYSNHWALEGYM